LYCINNEGVKPQLKQEIKMETLQTSTPIKKVEKVAIIKLDKDYNRGLRAWVIQESYDGEIPIRKKVMKREYFDNLQEKIMDYLSEGFKVEIENK